MPRATLPAMKKTVPKHGRVAVRSAQYQLTLAEKERRRWIKDGAMPQGW